MSLKNNLDVRMSEKPILHLLVTPLCDRTCKYCCNNQYNINEIPFITEEELKNIDTICITGGEPVTYSNPSNIAVRLKETYKNIKNVYVYANATELATYYMSNGKTTGIDGFSVSIKNSIDKYIFDLNLANDVRFFSLPSNRIYVFDGLYPKDITKFHIIDKRVARTFCSRR